MDVIFPLLAGLYGLVALLAAILFIQRLRSKRAKPKRRSKWGYFPVAAAIAFQQLNAIVHPHEQHVMQAMYDESTEEDDEGAPKDPTAHLHCQTEKIRRGETIDRLTTMVDSKRRDEPWHRRALLLRSNQESA